MAPHVVRTHAEEKRRLDLCVSQYLQQLRDPVTRATVGVDIDA
jgi:hypothetical protein